MPTGLGRHVDPRRPRDLDELLLDLALQVVAPLLIDRVPLVVGHDQRPPGVDDLLDDPDVLLGDRLTRVDEHDGDLGLLQCGLRPQRGIEVGAPRLVDPPPDASRVDEPPLLAGDLDEFVHGVAGRPGDRVHDDPLRSGDLVEQ